MAATGMIIDGIAASEAIDSSGEILDVEGCDISDLENGLGVLNWEHRNEESQGASPSDIVGKIIYCKKIFKRDECENERQRSYWDKINLPFIYIIGRLYDGAGHSSAKDLAAQIRDHLANNEPILCRYSIEGSTLQKDGQRLVRSIARRIAVTIKPCNRSCNSGVLEDPNAPKGFELKADAESNDALQEILDSKKSEHYHPNYTPLGGVYQGEYNPLVKEEDSKELLKTYIKLKALQKALTAGMGGCAPGELTGGAALQTEHLAKKKLQNQALAALRDYGKGVTNKAEFKAFVKHRLPEAADEFIDHFVDVAHDYTMKKSEQSEPLDHVVVKLQKLCIDLKKAVDESKKSKPAFVMFGGMQVVPGKLVTPKGEHYIALHEDGDRFVAAPDGDDWDSEDLCSFPKLKAHSHYAVITRPKVIINGLLHSYHEDKE